MHRWRQCRRKARRSHPAANPAKYFGPISGLDKPAIARPITQRGRCSVGICASCLLHAPWVLVPCSARSVGFDRVLARENVLEVTRLSFARQQFRCRLVHPLPLHTVRLRKEHYGGTDRGTKSTFLDDYNSRSARHWGSIKSCQ